MDVDAAQPEDPLIPVCDATASRFVRIASKVGPSLSVRR